MGSANCNSGVPFCDRGNGEHSAEAGGEDGESEEHVEARKLLDGEGMKGVFVVYPEVL